MSEPATWQTAFVATTFALGDTVEDARGSLLPADIAAASAILAGLAHATREVRSRTLAAALGHIVAGVEQARLA